MTAEHGPDPPEAPPGGAAKTWQKALLWLVTLGCFAFLYFFRIGPAAAARDLSVPAYLATVLETVHWGAWLPLMVSYSTFFFLIDSLVVWRIVNWFNARIRYQDILPIRASAYIISILNEQVGKGVMAVYLNRRDGVPGWQVGSSMLFIMFCEIYYLLSWATLGVTLRWDRIPQLHPVPAITGLALLFFVVWVLYFRGALAPGSRVRERQILHSFRRARWWQYWVVIALRSPALLAAIWVYWLALGLFGIDAELMDLFAYLPLIFASAALPLPLRAGPIVLWELIYPGDPGRVTTFALLQHNFFVFFNAAIGLVFLRRANRELFGRGEGA
jgi:hypothetical protein